MTSIPPQPYAHRPGPRSRPSPTATPEESARGRSSRRRGLENERRTFAMLVTPFFPRARRTRPGEAGPDIYTEGVGHRVMEFTVARWTDLPVKLEQAETNARQLGTTEYAVIKARQMAPGQRRRWYAILDGRSYMKLAAEVDILRAFYQTICEAPTPVAGVRSQDLTIRAKTLARLALEKLEVTYDDAG